MNKIGKRQKTVAIIGAGAAGLACAFNLEKFGIYPDVYEIQERIGGRGFDHTLGWMNIMYRPMKDPLVYLNKKYGYNIKPMAEIKRLVINSPNNSVSIDGKLGYIHLSGPDRRSIYHQIYPYIKNSNFKFAQDINFRQLSEDYDHVVMANGYTDMAELCGLFNTDVAGYVRGATVYGHFDPETIYMWFNTEFAQHAYAYFVPWSDRKGSLTLNMLETTVHGAAVCWKRFIDHINWDIEIGDIWETPHALGHLDKLIYDNIIFTGAAGGFLDPLFAFGNVGSLVSGGAAALHIAGAGDYYEETKFFIERNKKARTLRRYVDKFTNDDFDKMVGFLKTPMFRTLAASSNLNMVSILAKFVKTLVDPEKIDRVFYPGTKEVAPNEE